MKKILFFCALANVAAGVFLRQMPGALPILRAADGSWVYPQSSGSDDVHLLAAAEFGGFAGRLRFGFAGRQPVGGGAFGLSAAVAGGVPGTSARAVLAAAVVQAACTSI